MKNMACSIIFLAFLSHFAGCISSSGKHAKMTQPSLKRDTCSQTVNDTRPTVKKDMSIEIQMLQVVFKTDVSTMVIDNQSYLDAAMNFVRDKLLRSSRKQESQYFVFVDRNASRQNIMVGFYNAADESVSIIGWDKVSTGNPDRTKHYITPTGIFENSVKHMSFRAQGTRNKKGWMGFGVKGLRVWDFGWQASVKKGYPFNIRMMMHATDPKKGEPRLGKRDSKGCIRVSAKMNKFLDFYGIIDKDYEDHPKRGKRVLRKDRQTVSYPGWYLVIGDFK